MGNKDEIFNQLLNFTIRINNPHSKDFWTIFFGTLSKESDKQKFLKEILDNIEIIENNHHSHIFELFGNDVFEKLIFPVLVPDFAIYNFIKFCDEISHINDSTKTIFTNFPRPKTAIMRMFVNDFAQRNNIDLEYDIWPKKIDYEIYKKFEDDYELDDWIFAKNIYSNS